MNTTKISSYGKLIAFFVVVTVLLSTFAIAAGGWQITLPPEDEPQLPDGDGDDNLTDNTPSQDDNQQNNTPVLPKYYDYITGLEITEPQSTEKQFAYVIDSNSPLYGVYDCSMLIEFPTESGTRFLMLTNRQRDYNKIGSIAPTRNYISNLAYVFGARIVSLGSDDAILYDSLDSSNITIDRLQNQGSYYSEYTYFSYTNPTLVSPLDNSEKDDVTLPYDLVDIGNKVLSGTVSAHNISLPYQSPTSLRYSSQTGKYTLIKSGSDRIDVSSASEVSFDNVFILFADTMTYENVTTTEMVMNTLGSGEGYYIQCGMAERISWALTPDGQMIFYNADGVKLTVNRGNSYIGFIKSSKMNNVLFS